MTRKNGQSMTNILAIHNEWLEANGYTLHVKKKKNKTSQFKAQATRHTTRENHQKKHRRGHKLQDTRDTRLEFSKF